MEIMKFIPENLLILIAAIYVLGILLKKAENVKDKYITYILMIFGITFAVLLDLINAQYNTAYEVAINGVLQGILCWGAAIGINQTIKQTSKEE